MLAQSWCARLCLGFLSKPVLFSYPHSVTVPEYGDGVQGIARVLPDTSLSRKGLGSHKGARQRTRNRETMPSLGVPGWTPRSHVSLLTRDLRT